MSGRGSGRSGLLWLVGVVLVGGYLLVTTALYLLQDALIFPAVPVPPPALAQEAERAGATVHHLTTSDGTRLLAWHVPRGGDRVLVWLHGNGGSITAVSWFASQLPDWDVVGFSYRGYPGSDGQPSEAGLAQDADAVWEWLTTSLGFRPEQVVLHAQSMGGGVASHLMSRSNPAGAVLDSTFLSVEQLASEQYPWLPVRWLLRHPFRSDLRAPEISVPVLVLHGDRDQVIPVDHGRTLATLYPNATYREVMGGRHDTWLLDEVESQHLWRQFLSEVTASPR